MSVMPHEKCFSFDDFIEALEKTHSADLEPYGDLLDELRQILRISPDSQQQTSSQ